MAYVNELAGSKLRQKLGATLNEAAAAPSSDFARQQLEKMGWQQGQGLGKHKQGMASHIKVRKREDDVGLGHVKPELQQQVQWWNNSMNDVFSKLNGGKKKRTKKEVTDEDLFAATGGARFGMRAQRKQTGKWARAELISEDVEQEAKSKVEWNGMGQAKLLLSVQKKRKRKKKNKEDGSDDEESHQVTDEEELQQPQKKKLKKSKEGKIFDKMEKDKNIVKERKKDKNKKKSKKKNREVTKKNDDWLEMTLDAAST